VNQFDRTACGFPFKTLRLFSIFLLLYIHFQLTLYVYSDAKYNSFCTEGEQGKGSNAQQNIASTPREMLLGLMI